MPIPEIDHEQIQAASSQLVSQPPPPYGPILSMFYQVLDTQCLLGQSHLRFRVKEVLYGNKGCSVEFECPFLANLATPQLVTHAYCSGIQKRALCSTNVAVRLSIIVLPRLNQLTYMSLLYNSFRHGPVSYICGNRAIIEVSLLTPRQSVFSASVQLGDGIIFFQCHYSASRCEQ